MAIDAHDPMVLHPVAGQQRVVFLKPLVRHPNVEVGEYTYYDDPDDPLAFEREAVLYAYGPERLIHRPLLRDRVRRALPPARREPRRPRAVDVPVRRDLRRAVGRADDGPRHRPP